MSYVGTEDRKRRVIILEGAIDIEGEELLQDMEIPAKNEVCHRCEGRGVHDNPAFSNGITSEEWNGPDWDDDSRQDYRNGVYDVTCTWCHGLNVVLVIDRDRCSPEQIAEYDSWCDSKNESIREEAAERRMGC